MSLKLVGFLLVSVILSDRICLGAQDKSSETNFRSEVDRLKISHQNLTQEFAQLKESVNHALDKQMVLIERILNGSLAFIYSRDVEIQSCQSVQFSGTFQFKCKNCQSSATVYCEMASFDGGWIVIQQRLDGSENFTRNWQDYRDGFGTVGKSSEFWLGLEQIHQITNSGGNYELAIELKDENGKYGYARYSDFKIAGEGEKYRLAQLGGYSGTIGDELNNHKNMKFSTFDQENDEWLWGNCSVDYHSGTGWWYNRCGQCALNGSYKKNWFDKGIRWQEFTAAATFSRMMIRRK